MNPVFHFEIPYDEADRVVAFYGAVFGWEMKALNKSGSSYIFATTAKVDQNPDAQAGAINGGFLKRMPDTPYTYPTLLILVEDIRESMQKVQKHGGEIIGELIEINGGGLYVSFYDPEGNRLSMMQAEGYEG